MNEDLLENSGSESTGRRLPRALKTILYGGLAVGVLDALDAVIFFGLRSGTTPKLIFQYIAAGVLGREAYEGDAATAGLGIALHFLVAFIITAVYYGASRLIPGLIRRAVLSGMIYGVFVYFVMNFIVVPLSAAPHIPFALAPFLNGVFGHALIVGLPIALITRWSAKAKSETIAKP